MQRLVNRTGLVVMALLGAAVALVSMRYLLPSHPHAAPGIMRNPFAYPFLFIHAGTASVALLVGALQFVRSRRGRRAAWHRLVGVIYVACCLASAPAALVLALGSTAGPIASVGFGLLAVVWFYVTSRGLHAVLNRRYAEHGRWMLRSYALTFAAVTLRLYLPLGDVLGADPLWTYRATAYVSWIPNLLLVEAWITMRGRTILTTTAPA